MEGRRWIRVSVTRRTTRWFPFRYSLHRNCIRFSRSSRPRASFPCMPATYRNSGSPKRKHFQFYRKHMEDQTFTFSATQRVKSPEASTLLKAIPEAAKAQDLHRTSLSENSIHKNSGIIPEFWRQRNCSGKAWECVPHGSCWSPLIRFSLDVIYSISCFSCSWVIVTLCRISSLWSKSQNFWQKFVCIGKGPLWGF